MTSKVGQEAGWASCCFPQILSIISATIDTAQLMIRTL
jgi:hypothetical protein